MRPVYGFPFAPALGRERLSGAFYLAALKLLQKIARRPDFAVSQIGCVFQ